MRGESVRDPEVAKHEILSCVSSKWSVCVIRCLGGGPMRFSALRRDVGGISQRMLVLTSRGLERDGLLRRNVFATAPPRVDYTLTTLGRTLVKPALALVSWAERHRARIHRARDAFEGMERRKRH
jgi:DNA-binding HxlR family transcriptional regulator